LRPRAAKPRPRWVVELAAVVRKEVRQTLRDRRMMFLLIAAPLIQTIILGFAVDFDFQNVPTLVVDLDHSEASRTHTRRLLADRTLQRRPGGGSAQGAADQLGAGEAAAAVVLPHGLERDLLARRPAEVQVILDGTDPNRALVVASAATQYFGQVALDLARDRLSQAGLAPPPSIPVIPRALYNPGLDTAPFMIPGVMTMVLIIATTVVTAMGLSREREMGTLEQVLVTPVRPLLLLLGKMTPPLLIGCFDVFLVLTAGVWIFKLPVHGNPLVLVAATVPYLICTLGVGLLISTVSRTQQQSFLGGFLFIMPAILLSGVMTPIAAMPAWLQTITYVNPVRYFVEVIRANLLKGASFSDVWWRILALAVLGSMILLLATVRFRKRLS
jgi:ABC-2 type transport system permease protein